MLWSASHPSYATVHKLYLLSRKNIMARLKHLGKLQDFWSNVLQTDKERIALIGKKTKTELHQKDLIPNLL